MGHKSHKHEAPIPLHRVAVVRPFAQLLADIGTPVEGEFKLAGLPFHALENVDNYVPSQRFWAFVVHASHSQGIEDLGFRVGYQCGADSADPELTALLRQSPTLFHGLSKASALINKTVSHCRVGVITPPHSEYAYFYHRPSCDTDNPAIDQIGWFGLTTLIGMVRVFAGPKWRPPEMGAMTRYTPRSVREHFPDTHIRQSPQCSYIAFDKSMLSRSPFVQGATRPEASSLHYEPLTNDFAGTLKQALLSYVYDGDPSIELAAELSGTSVRTLQRRLAELGTRYSELLNQTRFRAARHMLQDTDIKVTDVANLLGYSDATHFARAFRRIAGISPRSYRQAYMIDIGRD